VQQQLVVFVSSHLLLVTSGQSLVVLTSSHLLLVTNGAVIGGSREFTSVVGN
jgi:hypothetical protein